MCTYFKSETKSETKWYSTKSDQWFFFLTLAVRILFHRKDFNWKKYGGTGLLSEKTEALHAEPNERAEAATSSYSAEVDFLQYIYSMLRIIRRFNWGDGVKKVRIRSYSGPHFSRIFPHSDWISPRIQSECRKIREKCGPE